MSEKPSDIAGRWWRTLRPLPVHTHVFRALNDLRKPLWQPALPVLVALWRQRAQTAATASRAESLLSLGKLLAAAPPPRADALLNGQFEVGRRAICAFPPPDWHLRGARPLEVYEAHYLDWADALVAAALNEEFTALQLLQSALASWTNTAATLPKAWEPYPRARRVLACLRAAARLTAVLHHGGDRWHDGLTSLRLQLLHIAATAAEGLKWLLERHLGGNHLLVDLLALAAAEAVWGQGDRAQRMLLAQCRAQFADDGAHRENSPMYHALLLEDLLMVHSLLQPNAGERLQPLTPMIARALTWLRAMRHPNGQVPSFGDSDPLILQQLSLVRTAVLHAAGGEPDPVLSAWTSRRNGHFAVMHTAPTAFAAQPGHAHADALSFEWSRADQILVCDAGLAGYEGDPQRELNRSAASHSVVEVPGFPAIELWASFRVGARGRVGDVHAGRLRDWDWCAATHFWPDEKRQHRRLIALHQTGALLLVDHLTSDCDGIGRILLAPDVTAAQIAAQSDCAISETIGSRFGGRRGTTTHTVLQYPVIAHKNIWTVLGGAVHLRDAKLDFADVVSRLVTPAALG